MPVMERKHSPMYFALWGFAGASLAAAAFFLPFASIPRGWLRAFVWRDSGVRRNRSLFLGHEADERGDME